MSGLDLRMLDVDVQADFLGREFLLWLWYRSEEGFGHLAGASGNELDLWVEDRLLLLGEDMEAQRFDLKGGAPATSVTARTALAEGRQVVAARFGMRQDDLEFTFELHADLSLRSVAIGGEPAIEDEVVDRLRLIDELLARLDDLFEAFCLSRLHSSWESVMVPRIRDWMHQGLGLDETGALRIG